MGKWERLTALTSVYNEGLFLFKKKFFKKKKKEVKYLKTVRAVVAELPGKPG